MSIHKMTKAEFPLSFGAFKPVGHVVVAFGSEQEAADMADELHDRGYAEDEVLHYSSEEMKHQLQELLPRVSMLAGFGYEILSMREYERLACDGCSWLVVYAPEDSRVSEVAEVAKTFHARLANKYNRLTMEELI